jgi:hypothetical protein
LSDKEVISEVRVNGDHLIESLHVLHEDLMNHREEFQIEFFYLLLNKEIEGIVEDVENRLGSIGEHMVLLSLNGSLFLLNKDIGHKGVNLNMDLPSVGVLKSTESIGYQTI